jgi:hypothetical protein
MSKILLSTVTSVTIEDLGGIIFTHPVVNFVLYDSALSQNEFELEELKLSLDLQEAVDNGDVLLVDGLGNPILDIVQFITSMQASSGGNVEISSTPPTDTSKLWFNSTENLMYFNDGTDWVTDQIYETTFNEQGNTPNNTFFRVGNTIGNDLGVGYNLEFDAKVEGLSFNRSPNTAQLGNFWLYSNSVTGTNIASVVTTFPVNTDARGYIPVPLPLTLNANSYITIRWNGQQTNNNVVSLKYRKKYT